MSPGAQFITDLALSISIATMPLAGQNTRDVKSVDKWWQQYDGTRWEGEAELWTDPLGNEADRSKSGLAIDGKTLTYTWSYRGEEQSGFMKFMEKGVLWSDTWHQPEPVLCQYPGTNRGLFSVEYDYPVGSGPHWSWRITCAQRPDKTLVVQMTNITPWGEEGRAVRMVFRKL